MNDIAKMSKERCPACGALVLDGRAGCQAVWDEISLLVYEHPAYGGSRDLAFDAYCMQHPEEYGRSAKSYAAHLTRLCCGLEYEGDTAVYAAIRQWLDGKVTLDKPPLLSQRGHFTVMEVRLAKNPAEHKQLVQVWAESVWDAYRSQQELAHGWIQSALAANRRGAKQR